MNTLLVKMIDTIAIRGENHRLSIRRPCPRRVVPFIELHARWLLLGFPFSWHFGHIEVRMEPQPQIRQRFATVRNAGDYLSVGTISQSLSWSSNRAGPRVQGNHPKIRVSPG